MSTFLTRYCRLIHIMCVALHYKLDRLILPHYVCTPLRIITRLNPYCWSLPKAENDAEALRLALETLGPIFIKLGQILSTRHDLLPSATTQELTQLQDKVAPFSSEVAQSIIEKTFNQPIESLFQQFESKPLASASIAQVHKAIRHNGQPVVIKILRPRIKEIIQRDLNLLYTIAGWLERFWPGSYRLHPKAVVAEFERCLNEETNLLHEAANAAQLKRQTNASILSYIPEIHWDYARKQVLVMEAIQGVTISDIATLKAQNVNLTQLAKNIVELFFTQVFKHAYFHADMHPGNLFVDTSNPDFPTCILIDFGIMGSLSPTDQHYLAENLLAFFTRDYRKVALLHIQSGWVPSDTRVDLFESAIRAVCEPLLAQPLSKFSMGQILSQLLQTAQQFKMEVLPQLLLLQKTVLNVESLARSLDPNLEIWSDVKPLIKQWMKEQMGITGAIQKIKANLPLWLNTLPEMPGLIYEALQHQQRYQPHPPSPPPPPNKLHQHKRKSFLKGLGLGLLIAALAMGVILH